MRMTVQQREAAQFDDSHAALSGSLHWTPPPATAESAVGLDMIRLEDTEVRAWT
jgi:hypothetical protein